MKRLFAVLLSLITVAAFAAAPNQANINNLQFTGVDSVTGNAAAPFIDDTSGGSVSSNTDHYGTQQYNAPNGELVAVPLYKLIGDVFTGAAIDPNFWTTTLGTGGSATIAGGELTVSTGTTANNSVELTSVRTARFSGLAPNKLRIVVQLPDTGVANNVRHWGVGTLSGGLPFNGAMFQMNGTTFELDLFKNGAASASFANGTFNGQYGPTFNPGIASHFYEIIYQPRQVVWLADNKIIHTFSASATPWTADLNLPIHFGSANSNGLASNVSFKLRIATVARFGIPDIQPKSVFVQGLTAGVNLKNTPGNLHGVILSGITNNSVLNIYDNTTAAGTLIWTSGGLTSNGLPFYLDFKKVPFSVGLSVSITGAAMNALMVYE